MSPVCVRVPWRLVGIDRLRGLAILLMVVDHALVAASWHGPGVLLVRLTATRAALPLFCLVAGALLRPGRSWGRLAGVLGAGLAASVLGQPLGIGQPDVLVIFALVLVVAPSCVGRWALVVMAVLQATTWPIPWTGYQPGLVLVLVLEGQLVGKGRAHLWGMRLPSFLGPIGRYPLALYVGHLLILRGSTWIW